MTLGSFKVTLICTINCFIIYFIIQNAVIQEINNGIINALFLVNSLKGSFFVECPLCFSFCFVWSFIWNQSKLCFVFCYVLSLPCTKMTHQSPIAHHAPRLLVLHLCQELTTLWVARLDNSAELKVTDPKEQQGEVEEEEAEG